MRTTLPLLLILLALTAAARSAPAQSMFMDVNGDGRGDGSDVLTPAVTSVDIYLDTNRSGDGAAAVCTDGHEPLSISSYTFIVEWEPAGPEGSLTYGAWSDNMGFTVRAGGGQAGRVFWVARAAPYYLAPGLHLLGSLEVRVTGSPVLRFLSWTPADETALTSFGSPCGGRDYDHTIKLGQEFVDARGTSASEAGPRTAWRTIRELYR